MAVSLVGGAITLNNWYTIPLWIGLIFAVGEGFIPENKQKGTKNG